jgi:hypothetical protein
MWSVLSSSCVHLQFWFRFFFLQFQKINCYRRGRHEWVHAYFLWKNNSCTASTCRGLAGQEEARFHTCTLDHESMQIHSHKHMISSLICAEACRRIERHSCRCPSMCTYMSVLIYKVRWSRTQRHLPQIQNVSVVIPSVRTWYLPILWSLPHEPHRRCYVMGTLAGGGHRGRTPLERGKCHGDSWHRFNRGMGITRV